MLDSRDSRPASWHARSPLELVSDQLAGIESWNSSQAVAEQRRSAAATTALTREMRLDASRRLLARKQEQAAVIARAAKQLERSAELLRSVPRPRALVVHRNAWMREKVATRLQGHGVDVLDVLEDGAVAVGVLVVEQPDLLFVEDRLPTVSGFQLLAEAARYAPRTVTAVQVLDGSEVDRYLDAGARAVFTRRIPPQEVADQLVACLAGSPRPVALV